MSERHYACESCGADLEFTPGASALSCPYCHHSTPIGEEDEGTAEPPPPVQEIDYHQALAKALDSEESEEVQDVKCGGCGALVTLGDNVAADECPFCATPITAQPSAHRQLRPKSLLPFDVTRDKATQSFKSWLASRWFAPSGLKRHGEMGRIRGMYVPYWTYDFHAQTHYRGRRGDDYWVTKTYTVNGKRRTKRVRKTRWRSVSGVVHNGFDDMLVLASHSLPRTYTEKLEPWDLHNLTPYRPDYLAGFQAESYQVDLEQGFGDAQEKADPTIRSTIKRDIGGDHQRISSMTPYYSDITFKHLLLPIWISAYRYKNKTYRFLVNGRTGEVQGERPWSALKIAAAVAAALLVVGGVWYAARKHQDRTRHVSRPAVPSLHIEHSGAHFLR